jgi:hypothetical protein
VQKSGQMVEKSAASVDEPVEPEECWPILLRDGFHKA